MTSTKYWHPIVIYWVPVDLLKQEPQYIVWNLEWVLPKDWCSYVVYPDPTRRG